MKRATAHAEDKVKPHLTVLVDTSASLSLDKDSLMSNASDPFTSLGYHVDIKEYAENHFDDDISIEGNEKIKDKNKVHYIIDQSIPFQVQKDIYCQVSKSKSSCDEKRKVEIENILIEIYSFKLSLKDLHKFL